MLDHTLGRVDTLAGLLKYHYCELQDKHVFIEVEADWRQGIAPGWLRCERCGLLVLPSPRHINCRCITTLTITVEDGG